MVGAEPERELRLALVLNGGVSLAVWMAGVAYEIDLLRRASAQERSGVADDAAAQQWWLLCHPEDGAHRRVVVDVIAGTSAGGINGTLLAAAVARGATLDPVSFEATSARSRRWLREVWTERACLERGKLLPAGPGPRSVLDGDYFSETIASALTQVDADGAEGQPVTLFITATCMGRSERSYVDSYGRPFTVADHRRLYQFEHAPRRIEYVPPAAAADLDDGLDGCFRLSERNDFALGNAAQLARAARASASFPVAFAPVPLTPGLCAQQAPGTPHLGGAGPLLDGGILDNSPFAPVLRAVAYQPLDSPADRLIVYVVPSNGSESAGDPALGAEPTLRQVIGSTMSFPREADFRLDVDGITELMVASNAAWEDAQALFTTLMSSPAERREFAHLARRLVPVYRRGRAAGGVCEAQSLARPGPSTALTAAPGLGAAEVEAVLATSPRWIPPESQGHLPLGDPATTRPWQWGVTAAHRALRLMLSKLRTDLDGDHTARLRTAVADVDEQLRRVLAVRDELERTLAGLIPPPHSGAAAVAVAVNTQLTRLRIPEVLGRVVTAAAQRVASVYGLTPQDVLGCVLTVEVLACSLNARVAGARPAPFRLLRLGPDVEVPVLSHDEAGELAGRLGALKLYGTQVGHFAAFGLAQWRDWDWLCGRLDAVAHLGAALDASPEWIKATQAAVLAAEGSDPDDYAQRMRAMRGVDADRLHKAMIDDERGGQNLFDLGQRLIQVAASATGDTSASARWLRVAVDPCFPADKPGTVQLLRWLTHPVRANAWSRLASRHAVLPEPAVPRLLDLKAHAIALATATVLALLAVAVVSTATGTTMRGALAAAAGVLIGFLAVLLAGAGTLLLLTSAASGRAPRWTRAVGGLLAVGAAVAGLVSWCRTAQAPGPHTAAAAAGTAVILLGLLSLGGAAGLHGLRRRLGRLVRPGGRRR
ncbi:hypothetical protein CS0771_59540 [Catellatospora sp. IY07-71]|uniref:DUF3376 domain-containing protein n=1 Tax=Catellatospora sp. IY07-71 TaxID=2728827 RepID=UPI001BB3E496|nr:DUF3376 domain-containing protein [Catellatospora sp. IY07-71]BCJ76410.1 hypothetical protein CS0771_59540 [Catellatospora sp. IY07-71]